MLCVVFDETVAANKSDDHADDKEENGGTLPRLPPPPLPPETEGGSTTPRASSSRSRSAPAATLLGVDGSLLTQSDSSLFASSNGVTPSAAAAAAVAAAMASEDESDEDEDVKHLVIDYSHGRPMVYDRKRSDGKNWFDPQAQVWLTHPDEPLPADVPSSLSSGSSSSSSSSLSSRRSRSPARGNERAPLRHALIGKRRSRGHSASPGSRTRELSVAPPLPVSTSSDGAVSAAALAGVAAAAAAVHTTPIEATLPDGSLVELTADKNWSAHDIVEQVRARAPGLTGQLVLVQRHNLLKTEKKLSSFETPLLMVCI